MEEHLATTACKCEDEILAGLQKFKLQKQEMKGQIQNTLCNTENKAKTVLEQ